MANPDALHMRVERYMREHPEVLAKHNIMRVSRKKPGEYDVDGRAVKIVWDTQKDQLMVIDGPMQQPIGDYMTRVEASAVFSNEGLRFTPLHKLPQEARVTFQDPGVGYSRLDAMKVAKEQAKFREKAADFARQGQAVPQDLIEKYEKSIDAKLGKRWSKESRSRGVELPAKAPGAPPAAAPAPAWWAGAAAAVTVQPAVASATKPELMETPAPSSYRPVMAPTAVMSSPGSPSRRLVSSPAKAAASSALPVQDVGYDRAELMQTMFAKRGDPLSATLQARQIAAAAAPAVAAATPPTAVRAGYPTAFLTQVPKAAPMQPTAVQLAPGGRPTAVPELHTQLVSSMATPGVPTMVAAQPQIVSASVFSPKSGSRPGNIYGTLPVSSRASGGA